MSKKIALVLLVALFASLLSACGGGENRDQFVGPNGEKLPYFCQALVVGNTPECVGRIPNPLLQAEKQNLVNSVNTIATQAVNASESTGLCLAACITPNAPTK